MVLKKIVSPLPSSTLRFLLNLKVIENQTNIHNMVKTVKVVMALITLIVIYVDVIKKITHT